MEAAAISSAASVSRPGDGGQDRAAQLAERRRESTEAQLARAKAGEAKTAERLAEVREAVSRVLGVNTRLSITRSEASLDFVYRAIDKDTGEIVNEWPQDSFIQLVRGVSEDVRLDVDAGLMLDSFA